MIACGMSLFLRFAICETTLIKSFFQIFNNVTGHGAHYYGIHHFEIIIYNFLLFIIIYYEAIRCMVGKIVNILALCC